SEEAQYVHDGHLGGEQTEFILLRRASWRPWGTLAFRYCLWKLTENFMTAIGGESLGGELCSASRDGHLGGDSLVIYDACHCNEKASRFMTAIWAVSKLSSFFSKELHDGHLGGDSLAFPLMLVHFT
ncbi:16835_t:CDS:2, partial [Racocetra persica]